MDEDFLRELGYLALASRLKRISDKMIHSGREMYKELNIDIEPNWFLVIKLLQKHQTLSVTEIADNLQFSHPSVVNMINKMINNDYVKTDRCSDDGRRQLISLSDKAISCLPRLESVWQAGTQGIANMVGSHQLLSMLTQLEEALATSSFKDRTLHVLNTTTHE